VLSFVPASSSERLRLLFLVALFVTLTSKGLALLPGYAFDDYIVTYIDATVPYYLSQGRFTQASLQWLATEAGLAVPSFYWPFTLSILLAFPLLVAYGFSKIGDARTPIVAQAVGVAIVCAHPYFTEYFTFRQALYNALIYVLMMLLHLYWVFRIDPARSAWSPTNRRSVAYAAGALVLAMGGHQLTFPMVLSITTMSLIVSWAQSEERKPFLRWAHSQIPIAVPYVVAGVIYVAVFVITKKLSGAENDGRGNVLPLTEFPGRLRDLGALCKAIVMGHEPILSRSAKYFALFPTLLLLAIGLRRNPAAVALAVAALLVLIAISLAPVALSAEWWPVPRSLSALAFVFGSAATVALILGRSRIQSGMVAFLATSGVLMVFFSSAMLNDQQRLNRWDLNKAQLIAYDVARKHGAEALARTQLINGTWDYPIHLMTPTGDLNASSFAKSWAYPGLIREASGYAMPFAGPLDPSTTECNERPKWPAVDSIYEAGEVIVVCL